MHFRDKCQIPPEPQMGILGTGGPRLPNLLVTHPSSDLNNTSNKSQIQKAQGEP